MPDALLTVNRLAIQPRLIDTADDKDSRSRASSYGEHHRLRRGNPHQRRRHRAVLRGTVVPSSSAISSAAKACDAETKPGISLGDKGPSVTIDAQGQEDPTGGDA